MISGVRDRTVLGRECSGAGWNVLDVALALASRLESGEAAAVMSREALDAPRKTSCEVE